MEWTGKRKPGGGVFRRRITLDPGIRPVDVALTRHRHRSVFLFTSPSIPRSGVMIASLTRLVALALTAFVFNLAAGQQLEGPLSCNPSTEVWNPKCNAHCEPTCTEGDLVPCSRSGGAGITRSTAPQGQFSERICRPKCNCKPGLIRATRDGPCVPRNQCAGGGPNGGSCKRNEEFRSCGTACPAVCGQKAPEACTAQCVPGCFCARGYIRDKNNLCIPTAACRAGRGRRPGRQRNIISNQHPPAHFF